MNTVNALERMREIVGRLSGIHERLIDIENDFPGSRVLQTYEKIFTDPNVAPSELDHVQVAPSDSTAPERTALLKETHELVRELREFLNRRG